MELTGRITERTLSKVTIEVPYTGGDDFQPVCTVILNDGRELSGEQRRKAWALIGEISAYNGDDPKTLHEVMKLRYCLKHGLGDFSLADCDMTTARGYITYLIDFVIEWGVPCYESPINYAEDIGRYLYACLYHRKCVVCGQEAQVHHVTPIGMGRDRKIVVHEGMEAMALCPMHHGEVHVIGQNVFDDKYHVYGISLDAKLTKQLRLGNGNNPCVAA